MRRNGIAVAAALLAAASFAAAPAAAGERVKLRFDSLMDLSVSSAPPIGLLSAKTMRLTKVEDLRPAEGREIVGRHVSGGSASPVTTSDAPAGFAGKVLSDVLAAWGVTFTATDADYHLECGLMQLFVEDAGGLYTAKAKIRLKVNRPDGQPVWSGEMSGEAQLEGRGGRDKIYNQALAGALMSSLSRFVADEELQRAMAAGRRPRRAAPAPPAAQPAAPEAAPDDAPAAGAVTPRQLLAELIRLRDGGAADDILVAFARQRTLSSEMTADDLLAFQRAGMPPEVVKAALERAPRP